MEVRRHGGRARSAIFAPLGDLGRAGQVEQRIAEAIRSGVLVPGERLPSEPDLAALLGVAVVTVREALTALRGQGLVTTTRGRSGGTFVADSADTGGDVEALTERLGAMSRTELHDRATQYVLVLAGCAELAAERAEPSEAMALRGALPAADASVGAWRHADAELWLSIAALTQSARVTRDVVRLEADFGALVRTPIADPEVRQRIHAGHLRLVTAIADGDADGARHLAQQQLLLLLDRVARTQADVHDRASLPRSAS